MSEVELRKPIEDPILEDLWLSLQASLPEELTVAVEASADEKQLNLVVNWKRQLTKSEIAAVNEVVKAMGGSYVNCVAPAIPFFQIPRPKVDVKPEFKPASEAAPPPAKKVEKPPVARMPSPPGLYVAQNCMKCESQEKCIDPATPEVQRICLEVQQLNAYRALVEEVHLLHDELKNLAVILKLKPQTWDGPSKQPLNATPNSSSNATSHDTSQHSAAQRHTVEDVRMLFPEDLDAMLSFEDKGEYVRVAPKQFLGSENFAKISLVVRGLGGEYISAGRESHFRVFQSPPAAAPQQPKSQPQQQSAPQFIQDFTDPKGVIWRATKKKDSEEYYWKASHKENLNSEGFSELFTALNNGDKAVQFGGGMGRWLFDNGDIGMKPSKKQGGRR